MVGRKAREVRFFITEDVELVLVDKQCSYTCSILSTIVIS